jgi:hypothetical protein
MSGMTRSKGPGRASDVIETVSVGGRPEAVGGTEWETGVMVRTAIVGSIQDIQRMKCRERG